MAKQVITHKFNGTKVTYITTEGEGSVMVEGTLNGGRALAAAKRATGEKNMLLKSVAHVARTYTIPYEVFMANATEVAED